MTEWLLVVVGLALTAGTGLFVAAEFSLVTVERRTVERAAESGDRAAQGLRKALRRLSTQLSSAQLGISITTLATGYVAEPSVAALLRGPLEDLGLPPGASTAVALTVALLVFNFLSMLFGELVPKNIAIAAPLATAKVTQLPQRAFTTGMKPLVVAMNGSANAILRRLLRIEPQEELASTRTPQELGSLVRHSAAQGTLAASTAALLDRSLRFGDKLAADVMTPRVRVTAVPAALSAAEVLRLGARTGFSRFPVYAPDPDHDGDGDLDTTFGLVHIKHAVAVEDERREMVTAGELASPMLTFPTTASLDPMLDQLRERSLQMAVVVDEWGGAAGIVTLEDLVEELVGDVVDEHDSPVRTTRPLPDGRWLLSGLLRPDEVGEQTGVSVPEGDYETLGGLVTSRLERIPDVGDTVDLEGARLVVRRMDGRRVDRVILEPRPDAGYADTDDDTGTTDRPDAPGSGR